MNAEPFGAVITGAAVLALLSWKWTLPLTKATGLILVSTIAGLTVGWALGNSESVPSLSWLAVLSIQGSAFLGLLAWLFYRDPDRVSPRDPRLILSPADGQVIYIRKVTPSEIPAVEKKGRVLMLSELAQSSLQSFELWQVGISMVFTDVHVNRAPIDGIVTRVNHQPGRFLSLRDENAAGVNERQTLIIENGELAIGLVQIASRLVRRIVAYVNEGDSVTAGKRIGMIKFGSQVDLFIPTPRCNSLDVEVGDRLFAGITVLGRIIR